METSLEFTLDFEYPERNHGFFATRVQNVIVKDERMEAFVIVKPLYDPRDIKPDSKFKAKLLPNRSGIELIEPSVPYYLLKSVKAVNDSENSHVSTEHPLCTATALEYRTQATAIAMDPDRQVKRTVMHFPAGLKGSNFFLNDQLKAKASFGKHELFTNAPFITQMIDAGKDKQGNPQQMKWTASFVYWKIVVDGTVRNTEVVVDKDDDDIFMSAMKSMSIQP
jgi:hypothetical protein